MGSARKDYGAMNDYDCDDIDAIKILHIGSNRLRVGQLDVLSLVR